MAAPLIDPVPLQTLSPHGGQAAVARGPRGHGRGRRSGEGARWMSIVVGGWRGVAAWCCPLAGSRRSLRLAHRSLARTVNAGGDLSSFDGGTGICIWGPSRPSALETRRRKIGLNRGRPGGSYSMRGCTCTVQRRGEVDTSTGQPVLSTSTCVYRMTPGITHTRYSSLSPRLRPSLSL